MLPPLLSPVVPTVREPRYSFFLHRALFRAAYGVAPDKRVLAEHQLRLYQRGVSLDCPAAGREGSKQVLFFVLLHIYWAANIAIISAQPLAAPVTRRKRRPDSKL